MSDNEKLIAALGRISTFCDMRPTTTTLETILEEVEHLLAAIDTVASLALKDAGAVQLGS